MNQAELSVLVDKLRPRNPSVNFYRLTYDHYARGFHLTEFYIDPARIPPSFAACKFIKTGSLQDIHSYILTNIDLL